LLFAVCCLLFAVLSQLQTLIWLKWKLFRNSLRSSKAVVNRVASVLGMLAALALSLSMALGLGIAAYALTSPRFGFAVLHATTASRERPIPSAEFIFFSIFSMSYLIWATVPVSIGSSRQFDPGNLLLYPISLRKLFAVDLLSEIASIPSVFAIPSILAIGAGAGLAQGQLAAGVLIAMCAAAFGIVLSKWVSTSTNSLFKKKRSRGESLLALIGTAAGLVGLLFAQAGPILFHRVQSISILRWTPPGAIAFALARGLGQGGVMEFILALIVISGYTAVFVVITYWLAQRAVLGGGKSGRRRKASTGRVSLPSYTGWEIPLASRQVSAIIEKELRYMSRNAQLRMMAAMPLILIVIRLLNRRQFGRAGIESGTNSFVRDMLIYGEGIMAAGGVLYVFLILSGVSCNLFAFEHAGMRTLVLSPIKRSHILVGKNIATSIITLIFCAALLMVNELVFGDISLRALLFAGLSFLIYAPLMSVMGNWLSMRFPKRMKFGTRMNVSGAVGLLLIPIILVLMVPPVAAVASGFVAQSLLVVYVTLAILALLSIALYLAMIRAQGELLQQKELELLEAVNDPGGD
jgi:hypothetical protein